MNTHSIKQIHIVTLQRLYMSQIFKSHVGIVEWHPSSKLVIAQIPNTNQAQYFYMDS